MKKWGKSVLVLLWYKDDLFFPGCLLLMGRRSCIIRKGEKYQAEVNKWQPNSEVVEDEHATCVWLPRDAITDDELYKYLADVLQKHCVKQDRVRMVSVVFVVFIWVNPRSGWTALPVSVRGTRKKRRQDNWESKFRELFENCSTTVGFFAFWSLFCAYNHAIYQKVIIKVTAHY